MNVTAVTSHFPTANKGFITTLGSSILASAVTVPLTSVAGLTNGTVFVGIIEPGLANEQEFTGIVDTAGVQITGVKWTDGSDVDHTAGVTIVDYVSATGQNMQTKALIRDHDQTGYHKTLNDPSGNEWIKQSSTASAINEFTIANAAVGTGPTLSATGGDTNVDINLVPKGSGQLVVGGRYDGWSTGALPAVNSVTNNGNRSYDITFASTVASTLSSGMRLRTTRTVAAPTQCTSLNGTTQYYSKSSPNKLTFTDDFVVSAWVKLTSYATGSIASRYNGTSGWTLQVSSSGQVFLYGFNASAANFSNVSSYQSVPLNKWVHITAQLDMSAFTATTTTSYIMFDVKDVPAQVSRGGTNPTALVQAGDLQIGANNATNFFPGKIAQVAIFNAKVTQATMVTYMSQGLSGSETSLASAYSFNGVATDLNTTTPNDLTANGAAVATNADSPFGNAGTSSTLDYALVQAISTTVATVQVPEGCTIPTSGGVTSVAYSVQGNPYGWPGVSPIIGYAQVPANFTTAGVNTAVSGLTTTVTLPATGGRVRVTAWCGKMFNTLAGASNTNFTLWDGTVGSGTQLAQSAHTSSGANYGGVAFVSAIVSASGSKTYNVGLTNSGGTLGTLEASATYPMYISVEVLANL